jgi:hypothetical protein
LAPIVGNTYTHTEVIRDLVTGDTINTGNSSLTADGVTLGKLEANEYILVAGSYNGNVFTVAASGADTLLIYDANSTATGVQQAAIVLVGVSNTEAVSVVNTNGVLSAFSETAS